MHLFNWVYTLVMGIRWTVIMQLKKARNLVSSRLTLSTRLGWLMRRLTLLDHYLLPLRTFLDKFRN